MSLETSPLGRAPAGVILRCGGKPTRMRYSFKPAQCEALCVVPFDGLGSFEALHTELKTSGWSLAVAQVGGGAAPSMTLSGALHIPGVLAVDPLCAACAAVLLARLEAE